MGGASALSAPYARLLTVLGLLTLLGKGRAMCERYSWIEKDGEWR
jgi:hypothetical protein